MPNRPHTLELKERRHAHRQILNRHPVEALFIDEGSSLKSLTPLDRWIDCTQDRNLPKVIIVAGPSKRITHGPSVGWRRRRRKRLLLRGYQSVEWLLNSMEQGSALDQERVFDVYYLASDWLTPPPVKPTFQGLDPRPMSNLLLPPGLVEPNATKWPIGMQWLPPPL